MMMVHQGIRYPRGRSVDVHPEDPTPMELVKINGHQGIAPQAY